MGTAVLAFVLVPRVSARSEQGRQRAVQKREIAEVVAQYRAVALLGTRRQLGSDRTKYDPQWLADRWMRTFAVDVWRIAASLGKFDREVVFHHLKALVGAMTAEMVRDYGAAPDEARNEWDAADWIRALPTGTPEAVEKVQKNGLLTQLRHAHQHSGPDHHEAVQDALEAALAQFDALLEAVRR
jgi:hypothetical protein